MASSNEQNKPKRISRPFGSNTEKKDAVQTNSKVLPSKEQVNQRVSDAVQRKHEYERLAKYYPDAAKAGMDLEGLRNLDKSITAVSFKGKLYKGKNYRDTTPQFKQDNRTDAERRAGEGRGQQKLKESRELAELAAASEVMNHPDNPLGWIPGVRTLFNIGADQAHSRYTGDNITPYTLPAGISLANDMLLAKFGLGGWKPYVGSYVGSTTGGIIGDRYFDSPDAGRIIGGLVGGMSAGVYDWTAQQANKLRFRRTWADSVKNTELYNTDIIHATPANNGITKGSQIQTSSLNDVGFFVTDSQSKTPQIIVANSPESMVIREGNLLTSSNTPFVDLGQDLGLWSSTFNPGLYRNRPWNYHVQLDNPTMQDAIRMVDSTPVGKYINAFENPGTTDIVIYDPNLVQLSKNIHQPYKPITSRVPILNENKILGNNFERLSRSSSDSLNPAFILNGYASFGLKDPLIGGIYISDEGFERFIRPDIERLINYYNSGNFARRLAKASLLPKRDQIVKQKIENLENTKFAINTDENIKGNSAITGYDDEITFPTAEIQYNVDSYKFPIKYMNIHEGSHASSLNLPEIFEHNQKIFNRKIAEDNLKEGIDKNDPNVQEWLDYITDVAHLNVQNPNAKISEAGGQLSNVFLYMHENNKSVDDVINSNYRYLDDNFNNFLEMFKPEFVKKLLSPSGIIAENINNFKDYDYT